MRKAFMTIFATAALLALASVAFAADTAGAMGAIGTDKPDFLVTNLLIELMF